MPKTYSTYEAKAKFSEVMRRVRAGQRVLITYRGEAIAEIRPLEPREPGFEKRLARLEDEGVLSPPPQSRARFRPLARRPGALKRFLESRE